MQQPTCTNMRIRSVQDAQKIFYGVMLRRLHMISRRLDTDEREALQSGCVYVWEEKDPSEITSTGIERFTEGRKWGQSRGRDEFLFYEEKKPPNTHRRIPWDRLTKQAYSALVDTSKGKRKWHLICYFSNATIDNLGTVDDLPDIKDLIVPPNLVQNIRRRSSKKARSSSTKTPVQSTSRTYAVVTNYHTQHSPRSLSASTSPVSESITMFEPYRNHPTHRPPSPSSADSSLPSHDKSHRIEGTSSQTITLRLPQLPRPPIIDKHSYAMLPSAGSPQVTPASAVGIHQPLLSPPLVALRHPMPKDLASGHAEPRSLPPMNTLCLDSPSMPALSTPSPLSPIQGSPFLVEPGSHRELSYELSSCEGSESDGLREGRALAPIQALERRHLYHRDPLDDKALRSLPAPYYNTPLDASQCLSPS